MEIKIIMNCFKKALREGKNCDKISRITCMKGYAYEVQIAVCAACAASDGGMLCRLRREKGRCGDRAKRNRYGGPCGKEIGKSTRLNSSHAT